MKRIFGLSIICIINLSCNSNSKDSPPPQAKNNIDTIDNFFPVTNFIKGEIFQIKNGGITPLRKVIVNGKSDSSWVKMENIDSLTAIFTTPIIDTANCNTNFTENKFLDQTINAFTFSYEPKAGVQNNFAFAKWDVYVNPETEKVTRIYLVKKISEKEMVQLTWQVGKSFKIVTLNTNGSTNKLEKTKEETLTWKFD